MTRLVAAGIVVLCLLAGCQALPVMPTDTPVLAETITNRESTAAVAIPTAATAANEPAQPPLVTLTSTPEIATAPPSPSPTAEPPTATPTPRSDERWVNAPDGLFLRSGASTTTQPVTLLEFRQHLTLITSSATGAETVAWQNVQTDDGQSGWVSAEFLSTTPAPEMWVSAQLLNLRTEPAFSAMLIAQIKYGQRVFVLSTPTAPDIGGTSWLSVTVKRNVTGWASLQFLVTADPLVITPAVTAESPVSSTVTPPPAIGSTVYITPAEGAILRTAPDQIKGLVLEWLVRGQRLTLMGSPAPPDSSGFVYQNVQTDCDNPGWVVAQFLSPVSPILETPGTTTAPSAVLTSTAQTREVCVTAAPGLWLRAGPDPASNKITTLQLHWHLVALGTPTAPDASGNVWQNVHTDDGKTGWVAADYLSPVDLKSETPGTLPITTTAFVTTATLPTPALVVTSTIGTHEVWVIAAEGLNLRAEANPQASVIAILKEGQHLIAIDPATAPDANGHTWQNVRTDDGTTGWVVAEFLSTSPPAPSPPVAPTTAITP